MSPPPSQNADVDNDVDDDDGDNGKDKDEDQSARVGLRTLSWQIYQHVLYVSILP